MQVKVEKLKGKFVCFYYIPLSDRRIDNHNMPMPHMLELLDLNRELSKSKCLCIVFLGGGDSNDVKTSKQLEKRFNYLRSEMPWLAIPYTDSESRKRISSILGFSQFTSIRILDQDGRELRISSYSILSDYGAEAYPFTPEKMKSIIQSDREARDGKSSLQTVLSSFESNDLIDSDGRQVSMSSLEGKIVGLFFYLESAEECNEVLEELKEVYKQHKGDFEVVLVHLHFAEYDKVSYRSFKKVLKRVPWLLLPYRHPLCRKLWRIFVSPDFPGQLGCQCKVPILVIFGRDGIHIESQGADVLKKYKADAYPFTRKKAAEIEFARLRDCTLHSLFDEECVLRGKDESRVSSI